MPIDALTKESLEGVVQHVCTRAKARQTRTKPWTVTYRDVANAVFERSGTDDEKKAKFHRSAQAPDDKERQQRYIPVLERAFASLLGLDIRIPIKIREYALAKNMVDGGGTAPRKRQPPNGDDGTDAAAAAAAAAYAARSRCAAASRRAAAAEARQAAARAAAAAEAEAAAAADEDAAAVQGATAAAAAAADDAGAERGAVDREFCDAEARRPAGELERHAGELERHAGDARLRAACARLRVAGERLQAAAADFAEAAAKRHRLDELRPARPPARAGAAEGPNGEDIA